MIDNYNKKIAGNIKSILSEIGESTEREGLIKEIKDFLHNTLNPKGVAVVIDAQHLCMQMRGVQKQLSSNITSAFSVIFLQDEKNRSEFMKLIE